MKMAESAQSLFDFILGISNRELMRVDEVARRIGVERDYVYGLISDGSLEIHRRDAHRSTQLITRRSVLLWLMKTAQYRPADFVAGTRGSREQAHCRRARRAAQEAEAVIRFIASGGEMKRTFAGVREACVWANAFMAGEGLEKHPDGPPFENKKECARIYAQCLLGIALIWDGEWSDTSTRTVMNTSAFHLHARVSGAEGIFHPAHVAHPTPKIRPLH
jgi:excisionase family DNA binding protein